MEFEQILSTVAEAFLRADKLPEKERLLSIDGLVGDTSIYNRPENIAHAIIMHPEISLGSLDPEDIVDLQKIMKEHSRKDNDDPRTSSNRAVLVIKAFVAGQNSRKSGDR